MKKLWLVVAVMAVLALASPAQAATVIDFGTGVAGVGGIYTLLPGGHASGVGIPVGALTIEGAPQNNGTYFTTGTAVGNGLLCNGCASLDFNTLTNTITVTGGVPVLNIPNGTILLTGSFTTFTADVDGMHGARGPDEKAAILLRSISLPLDTPFAFFGFSLTSQGVNDNGVGSIISTDIRNTAVPEPGSMLLLGTGLFGLAGAVRRRMKK